MGRFRLFFRRRLDWYVLREVLAPTAMGFVTYTFLLLLRAIFALLEQILVRGVSAKDAGLMLWLSLAHVVVLTVPMSFLFGVLIAIGRMSSENEIVALQAGGISLRRILYPVVLLSLIFAGFNAFLTVSVMPRSNRELVKLKIKLFSSAKSLGEIEPRVFYEEVPNMLLYVRDVSRDSGLWKGVLIFERGETGEGNLIVARSGRLVSQSPTGDVSAKVGKKNTGEPWLLLNDVVSHQYDEFKPQTYRVNVNRSQLVRLTHSRGQGRVSYTMGMRSWNTSSLLRLIRERISAKGSTVKEQAATRVRAGRQRRLAMVELQKRIAIPVACLVFGLIGFPLAIGSRAGGRGRGFILSVGVILVYYVLLNHGELLSRDGRIPAWLGVWIPNILVAVVALFLFQRSASWLGERSQAQGAWWREAAARLRKRWFQRPAGQPAESSKLRLTGSIPVALQRRRAVMRFPALIDRYVFSRLMAPLSLVLSTTAALYIVVDFADKIDELAKHKASLGVFLAYYWNLIPQVALDVTPLALMIAVLVLCTILEKSMELTAIKAGGISLFRVVVPVLVVAGIAAGGLGMLQESIVPKSNREAKRLLDRIKGRTTSRSFSSTDRQWLFSRDGSTLYNFLRYDKQRRTLVRLTLFRFDEDGELRFHLFADRVRYDKGSWVADSGWFRQIYPDGTDTYRRITRPMELDVPEAPTYFASEYRTPAEMSFRALRAFIHELKISGYRPIQLIVRLHQKVTYPLSPLVMVFLALPFGLNRSGARRVSPMHGIAWGLGLGMGYFLLVAVFGKMGEANVIPPLLGAWAPVILAALFALNRMTTLRT